MCPEFDNLDDEQIDIKRINEELVKLYKNPNSFKKAEDCKCSLPIKKLYNSKGHEAQKDWKDFILKIFKNCIEPIPELGIEKNQVIRIPCSPDELIDNLFEQVEQMKKGKMYIVCLSFSSIKMDTTISVIGKKVKASDFKIFQVDKNLSQVDKDLLKLKIKPNDTKGSHFIYHLVNVVDGQIGISDPISSISDQHFHRGKGTQTFININGEQITKGARKKESKTSDSYLLKLYKLYREGESNLIFKYEKAMFYGKGLNSDIKISISFYYKNDGGNGINNSNHDNGNCNSNDRQEEIAEMEIDSENENNDYSDDGELDLSKSEPLSDNDNSKLLNSKQQLPIWNNNNNQNNNKNNI
ncbi:hypothetical protein PIROE2DRAFT_65339, partial [Piromyces sp. E2]